MWRCEHWRTDCDPLDMRSANNPGLWLLRLRDWKALWLKAKFFNIGVITALKHVHLAQTPTPLLTVIIYNGHPRPIPRTGAV